MLQIIQYQSIVNHTLKISAKILIIQYFCKLLFFLTLLTNGNKSVNQVSNYLQVTKLIKINIFILPFALKVNVSGIGRITANVECMQRAGFRGHFIIHRYCPCQRALNLQIDMNRPKGARRRQTRMM